MNTDRENEDSLIAEIIGVDWAADDAIATQLRHLHFQYPENGAMYFVVESKRKKGEPVNVIDIVEALKFCGYDEQMIAACVARLDAMRMEVKSGTSVNYYARKIIAAWQRKQHRASMETTQRDISNGIDWQEAEAQHQERLNHLLADAGNGMQTFQDSTAQLLDEMEGVSSPGLKTGFRGLDDALLGLRPGNMIVIAAQTGGGKSALGLGIGINVGNRSQRVCIVSAEMTTPELHERAAAIFSSINPVKVRRQQLSSDEKRRWREAVHRAAALPVFIDRSRDLSTLLFRIRASHRRQPWDLVIVDYAQLIQTDGHTREREVAAVTSALKAMAEDLNIPIIVLSQLNKDSEKRIDKRPRLSDLRESMALAHDADIVLMLYRDADHNLDTDKDLIEVSIRKGRSIGHATIEMMFRGEFTRFEDKEIDTGKL